MSNQYVCFSSDLIQSTFRQGLGNQLLTFYAAYGYCRDNRIPLKVDVNGHYMFRIANIDHCNCDITDYYMPGTIDQLRSNGKPYTLYDDPVTLKTQSDKDVLGFNTNIYRNHLDELRTVLNIPKETIDVAVMHIRIYTNISCKLLVSVGIPYYINAVKHIKNKTIYILSGYNNYDINKDNCVKNIQYIVDTLKEIYPDKEFIDAHNVDFLSDPDPEIEEYKHICAIINAKEAILSRSTFSIAAGILRAPSDTTVISNYLFGYGYTFDMSNAINTINIPYDIVYAMWFNRPQNAVHSIEERRACISEFFKKVSNANIFVFTDDQQLVDEYDWMAHVRIIKIPTESLPTYRLNEWVNKCAMLPSYTSIGRSTDPSIYHIWFSKIYMMPIIQQLTRNCFDRLMYMDIGSLRENDSIEDKCVFPILDKCGLNRVHLYDLRVHNEKCRRFVHDERIAANVIIVPDKRLISPMVGIYNTIIEECAEHNIYLPDEEILYSLMVDLTDGLFALLKSSRNYVVFKKELSETFDSFTHSDGSGNDDIQPISVHTLVSWIENHKKNNPYSAGTAPLYNHDCKNIW